MPITIALIDGHPDPAPERLCHALATAYEKGAREAGHTVQRIDIAGLDVPMLRTAAEFTTGAPPEAGRAAQAAIAAADHVVIVYPVWLGTMPAALKAFLEQTLRPGFAFDYDGNGFPRPRLKGKSARIVVTMGMPAILYRWYYAAHGLKNLERNILNLCGFGPVRDTIFGMVGTASDAKRAEWLRNMEALGRKGA